MWLNCIFGGKGVGLINMLVYLIVAVFLAGLMVGRTPEYLGKKVEAREMKLAMLALLIHPIMILGPTGLFAAWTGGPRPTNNPGPHGFSRDPVRVQLGLGQQRLGLRGTGRHLRHSTTTRPPAPISSHWDIATGLVMLIGRFMPIIAPLALAGSLAAKKPTPFTAGTLRTDTITFGFVLLGTILLLSALVVHAGGRAGPGRRASGPDPVRRLTAEALVSIWHFD